VAFQFLPSPLSLMRGLVTVCRTALISDWKRLPKYIYYFRVSEYHKVLRSTALANSWSMSPSRVPDYRSDLARLFSTFVEPGGLLPVSHSQGAASPHTLCFQLFYSPGHNNAMSAVTQILRCRQWLFFNPLLFVSCTDTVKLLEA
jgi:hypothetical protein